MSALEMTQALGKLAAMRVGDLEFEVRILDVRTRYGRTDYQVTPVAGKGKTWKSEDSIKIRG